MIQAVPAEAQHIPVLEETFKPWYRRRQESEKGYLADPGLLEFHWLRVSNDINKSTTNPPYLFFQNNQLIGYAKVISSPWHTEHFGIPHFKIHPLFSFTEDHQTNRGLLQALKALFPSESGCVVSTRLDSSDTVLLYSLSEEGFLHVGTSIRMVRQTPNGQVDIPTSTKYDNCQIRPFAENDLPALQAMITKSHKHSHFFREVRFPQEKTKELFAEWIRKCAGGLADIIFVAEKNESIIGFCSLLSNTSLLNFIHKKVGIIDFIVVDETAQGLGIGKSLLDRTFAHFADTGLIELRTMADNIGAIRFYHHNGFSILSSDQYYHYWT